MHLKVADQQHAAGLRLVAQYSGVELRVEQCSDDGLQLVTPQGQTLQGHNTVAQFISSQGAKAQQLLGQGPTEQTKILEWLSLRNTQLTPLKDEKLLQVDAHLLTRVFLVGNAVTLADLVIFAAVQPAVGSFPVAQLGHFVNLLRWYDFIQHTVDTTGIFPKVSFAKPPFTPPPIVAAAPVKVKPAEEKPKEKAKDKRLVAAEAASASAAPVAAAAPAAATSPAASGAPVPQQAAVDGAPDGDAVKKGKKEKKEKKERPPPPAKVEAEVDVSALDIRVGKILSVEHHPAADSLYVEQIDLGEDKPRQVVSGLVKFVPIEQMQGRLVVVVTNLKPAKMREVMSYGMVLCASDGSHERVDPVSPPEGVAVGEKVAFEGFDGEPEAVLNPKKKVFERIAPDLTTDANGVAQYKSVPFQTSKGPITSSIPNGHVK